MILLIYRLVKVFILAVEWLLVLLALYAFITHSYLNILCYLFAAFGYHLLRRFEWPR